MNRSLLLSMVATLMACADPPGPPDPAEPDPVAVAATVRVRMDSAAEAYRSQDFERARRLYEEAAGLDTALAAAWFGVFMTRHALGHPGAADSALQRARRLAEAPGPARPRSSQ